MEEKKQLGEMLGEFFAGKGFYIVLLLCAALIATSIWLMADRSGADVELSGGETEVGTVTTDAARPDGGDDALPTVRVDEPVSIAGSEAAAEAPAVQAAPNAPEEQALETWESLPTIPEVDYFIWPVNGALLRSYSVEALSYDPTMTDWRVHSGWDIAAEPGERVLAAANGMVSACYADELLGTVVEVTHSNGLVSVYANLGETDLPEVGRIVSVGSVLGAVGGSALCESGEASHLHFALRRDGEGVDPAAWLPAP